MKYIYAIIMMSLLSLISKGATVTFNTIYKGTGNYTLNSSSISITMPIVGSNFKFTSANPSDVQFSGNNVAGQLSYVSGGLNYRVNGVISRKVGNSNNYSAFYFAETTVLGGSTTTGVAYLFVVPTKSVTNNSSVSTNSSPVNSDLNEFLTIQDTNNNPPNITSNGGGQNAYISIIEGTTLVTTVTSVDVLVGSQTTETATYSISGGADAAKFTINPSTGQLSFISLTDYEQPTDVGQDNIYEVQVTVSDIQGATDLQNIFIAITDINDSSPIIYSNGGGNTASVTISQGEKFVTTVQATDADYGDVITYSIVSGANSALFDINSTTGTLSFKTNATVGTYTVTVRATDSAGNNDNQTLTVNVSATDVTRPTLIITSSDNNLHQGETCTISFRFSELVNGFTLSDITTEGGNISNLNVHLTDSTLYTATFTQMGSAYAPKITVAENSYYDKSNNLGFGSSLTLAYDVVAPTVAITFGSADISFGETELVIFTFSENPGTSFTINDISVTNSELTSLIPTANPNIWHATIIQNSAISAPVVTVLNQSYSDPAGNLGSAASNTIPLVPPTIDLANTPESDTGISYVDNITTNRKPVITGFVASGITSVTVSIQYYVNAALTTITYTNVPVSNQVYSVNLSTTNPSTGTLPTLGLPEGYIGLSVTTPTSATASNQFYIDLTPPLISPTANNLTTYDATPTITGTATLTDSETLRVRLNNITYIVGNEGLTYNGSTWSLAIPSINKLTPGTYPIQVFVVDIAGNQAQGNGTLIIQPSTLTIDLANTSYSDTGVSNTDNITSNRKPIIVGTSNGSDLTVKVTVSDAGYNYIYNPITINSGSWSLNLETQSPVSVIPTGNFPTQGLPAGQIQLNVEGNTSGANATNTFTIDFSAPSIPTVNSTTSASTTPTITGTANIAAGEILRVTINGIIYTNGDGRLSYNSRNWTLNIPTINSLSSNNTYPILVSVTDLAGNIATGEGNISITNATVTISLAHTSESDNGVSNTDNITSNRKPVIVGTASVDGIVTVTIHSGINTYTFANVGVVGGNWSLNLTNAQTSSGSTFPEVGLNEGTISLHVLGNTSAAISSSEFQLIFESTTTADGTWSTVEKWDSYDKPNSEIAKAILKHKITIPESENIVCKDITIESEASLTNNSNLTIKENLILKVSNNNKSSNIVNNGQITNQGRVIIRKNFSREFGWYFMSFPFDVPANKIFIAGTNTVARWGDPTQASTSTKDFYVSEYDGARRDATGLVDYISNSPNWKDVNPHILVAKKGYIIAVPGDIEIDFVSGQGETSIFNPNSTVDVQKHLNNQYAYHNSWNLIGIPFATSYKLNTATQAPFYSYNKVQSNYDVVMTSDDDYLINPYFSFFMQASANTIDFSSTGRMLSKSVVIAPLHDEINLVLKNEKFFDRTRIKLENGGDPNYVIGTDAIKMFSDVNAVPQIYTNIGACPVSYNSLPNSIKTIDVSVKIGTKGNYELKLVKALKAQSYTKIVLYDNLLNKQQDLLQDSIYLFSAEVGTSKRFKILLSKTETTDNVTSNKSNITAYAANKNITINGIENNAKVKIYSLKAELLYDYNNVIDGMKLPINYVGMVILEIENNDIVTVLKVSI